MRRSSRSSRSRRSHPDAVAWRGWRLTAATLVLGTACARQQPHDAELEAAVRSAYLLERRVLEQRSVLPSREAVARIYREGFSDDLAERLASASWSERHGGVHPGGFLLEPPARVVARTRGRDGATVVFETPVVQRLLWLERPYTVAELRRENGRWLIVRATSVRERPEELRARE